MGYHIDHFVVVTGGEKLSLVREKAVELFSTQVTPLTAHPVNGGYTFMVVPDGSKAGWQDNRNGDAARSAFIEFLEANDHGWLQWFVVRKNEDGPFTMENTSDPEY